MELLTRCSGYTGIVLLVVLTYIAQTAWTICVDLCTKENKEKTMEMCLSATSRLEESTYIGNAWTTCVDLCTKENKEKTMEMCLSAASRLDESTNTGNGTAVCIRFHGTLECIGKNVPQYLEIFSEQYDEYTYSPWNCNMSDEHIISYQKLVKNGCGSTSKSEPQPDPTNKAINIDLQDASIIFGSFLVYIANL